MRGWVAIALSLLVAGTVRAAEARADAGLAELDARHQVLVLLNMPAQHFRPDTSYTGGYEVAVDSRGRRRIAIDIAARQRLKLVDAWPMPMLGLDCFVMAVPIDRAPGDVAAELSKDARVMWAQPMNVFSGQHARDPLYAVQPAAQAWQLSALHEFATGRGVSVAVIDSGVERNHPDLAGRVQMFENFLPGTGGTAEWHGTGVAGIIAANVDNGIGIVGVAPHASLVALRACWQESQRATLCTSLSLAKAIYFAMTHEVAIINMSLAGPQDRLLARLLDAALARGITVVAAIDRTADPGGFPASHPGVVAVADDGPGALPAGVLRAPGRDIPTTVPGARWALVSGSSYAAAHVAGLFALVRELRHSSGGRSAAALALHGSGEIDACATLSRVAGPCLCACADARADGPALHR